MNVNIFETENIAGKLTSNLLQVKEPPYGYRQYLSQRLLVSYWYQN